MDNHKPIELPDGKYAAPTTGWYSIKTEVITSIPTLEYKTIPNPDKKWWQFWKKDYINQQIYKIEKVWAGSEMKLLVKGEIVDFPILYKIQ